MRNHFLISIFFSLISILIFSYTFYNSEIIFNSTRHDFYLKYYLISVIFFIFSILTFFISQELKIKIFLVIVSILFTFYVLEFYLLLKFKSKFDFNNYNILNEYKKEQKKNKNITIAMLPRQIDEGLHSLAGISMRETIYCNEHGYFTKFKSDRFGFNNKDYVWNFDKIDFLLVGDSFLLGSCVKENETIVGNLIKISGSNKIMNLGYSGNDPLLEYATLKEFLPLISSENVIWIYYEGNDFLELKGRLKNNKLNKYLIDDSYMQNLSEKQKFIDQYLDAKAKDLLNKDFKQIDTFKNSKLVQFIKLYNLRTVFLEPIFIKPNYKEFEKIISNTNKLVKRKNSNLIFVYIPTYESLSNFKFSRHKKNYKKVLEIIKNQNITVIDMYKKFNSYKDPLKIYPFKDDGHLDNFGYSIIAESIYEKLN